MRKKPVIAVSYTHLDVYKRQILGGVVLLASMFAIGAAVKEYHIWINGLFALVGVAWAAINVNSYPMVVEMSKGSDIGKFTGFYYTCLLYTSLPRRCTLRHSLLLR